MHTNNKKNLIDTIITLATNYKYNYLFCANLIIKKFIK